jgi:SH3-like domain-containing protein
VIKIKIAAFFLLAIGASCFIVSDLIGQTRREANKSAKISESPPVIEKAQVKCSVEAYRAGFADETPDSTNVRSKPDKNSAVLKSITTKNETVFYITGSANGWFEISKAETIGTDVDEILFEGRGWVHSSMVAIDVANSDPKLYHAPRKKSRVLKKLIADASLVRPIACRGDWMKVKSGKQTGWLSPGGQCANPLTTCS